MSSKSRGGRGSTGTERKGRGRARASKAPPPPGAAGDDLFRTLFRALPVPLALNDAAGNVLAVNDRFTEVLGYTRADIPSVEVWFERAYPDPATRAAVRRVWEQALGTARATGAPVPTVEVRVSARDGSQREMVVSGAFVGENLLVIFYDVTEKRAAEQALDSAQRRLEQAFRQQELVLANAAVGIALVREGRVVWANARMERIFGYPAEELQGASTRVLFATDAAWRQADRDSRPALARGETSRAEIQMRRQDGRMLWVRLQGQRVDPVDLSAGTIWCMEDVTELRELASRAARAARLAATGALARGLAHELNSPLTALTSNLHFACETLRTELEIPPVLVEDVLPALDDAAEAARRVVQLVADLRSFALGDIPTGRPAHSVASAVEDARRVSARDLSRCAEVEVDLPPLELPAISHPDLVQVLAHLLSNAGQATGERPNRVRVGGRVREDGRFELQVSDTGAGMDDEVLARAFEPFFTTRAVGKGRGLGLSVCLGIVESLGGEIQIASQPGEGTRVTVLLPRGPTRPKAR